MPKTNEGTPEEPEPIGSGGMFGKDKEIGNRIDSEFELREPFILWGVTIPDKMVDTKIGPAAKCVLDVSRTETPDQHFEVATLASAIVNKAKEATPDDFPAVVELRRVQGRFQSDTLVLQFVRAYK